MPQYRLEVRDDSTQITDKKELLSCETDKVDHLRTLVRMAVLYFVGERQFNQFENERRWISVRVWDVISETWRRVDGTPSTSPDGWTPCELDAKVGSLRL